MNRKFIAATLLCVFSATANALVWSPTDVVDGSGDVNTLRFSIQGSGEFAIFDAGTLPSLGPATLTLAQFDRITFELLADNTWEIANRAGETLNLGLENIFQFAYFDGAQWTQETTSNELGTDTNSWLLGWGSGISAIAVDVAPIPVPASVWLMGSAMGLLMMRRRRQT